MQPPIWKKFVTTSGFGDRNEEGIRAELQQERLAEQSAPKVKAGIGTLQIENNGFIEERDAEEFEDDPVFGRIATESIFKREAKKARDEADAAKLEMDNPNRIVRQRLRPEKREEILNEGKMLQEDNPRHAELKRMLIEDDEITELERKRYEAQQRLQELSSMGVEGFRQRRAEERLAMAQQQEQRLAEQEEVLREREARGLHGSEIEQHEAEKRSVIEQRKIAEDRRTRIATGIIEEKPTEAANVAPTEEDKKLAEWKSMKPDQRLAKKLQDFKLFSGVTQSIGVADQTGITRRADGTWETPAFVRQYDDMATNIVKSGTNLIRGGLDLKGGGNAEETEAMNQALYQFQQENNLSDEEVVSAWNDFTKRNNDNWNEGEKVRTLSDGEIVLNPTQENVLDRDSIMQVIESAPTTPEAKQEAAQNYEYLAKNIAEQRMFAYEAAGLGVESPSEYAARTGKPIAAINTPEFVSEYEREVIDKEPTAKKYGRSLAADIIIGFSQIATQTLGVGAYVTGSKTLADLSAEGSEGAQAINQGKANTGIAGAVVQNAIPILPMVVGAQLIAAGGAAAGVTAGVVGLASRAYSLLTAGAQSLGATYAEQRADGKTHEEASEKATRAGINTALITGIFNLVPGLAGVEKYTGGAKKAVADVTIREILKSTSKKELAKRVYSFTKDKVLAGLGEGAEEGLDTLTNEFINADTDTNLSTAWKNAVESAKVGALIGSAVDVVGSTGFGARQKASAQLANQGQAPIQTEEERKAASIIRDRAADPAVLAQSVSAIREIETALSNDTNLQPQASIAMGALKISSGQQLDELTAAELTALGIDRTGKPLKDAVPMIEMLNGRPVILDAAVQALESIAPSSKGLVAMTEAEARQKFVRNRFTVTSQSGDVVEVEARDEQEATRLGAMQFATGDIVQSVTPITPTAAGAAAQGGANAAGSGATGSAGAGTAGASGSAPAQQQPQAITPEAQKMLADVDAGGVPTIVTGQMEQIAKANGINVTPDMTPQAVIDALRAKQATSTPAKQRPAAAAETPAQKAIRKAHKKSKIAGERMQETSDPNVMIEARADGRIIINPEVLNKTAENLGLSGSQAEKWIADAIDEEVRHQVQIDAAREMWQSSGSNETFDQWLVDRYSAIWESEFVAKGKDSIVEQLYGPDLVNMPTWMRAMEGERMLWQKKYRGNPTEVARLWIDLGKETLENVKALLRRLKKMLKDGEISAEFQADIDALELRLKQAETAPAAPTGNIKAGQIVTGKVTSNNPDINGAVMSGTVRQVGSGFILVDTESGAQRVSISDVTEVREVKSDNKPKQDADQNQGEDQITDVSQVDGLRVIEFPVDRLELSQDVPQFKGNADEKGVVEPLEGKYERLGTGPILVWIRSNGKAEVISGRHRFDLAKRTGEKTIPAQVVRESDGFTKAMAMTADAELNIRDGQGEVKDYANYFKATNMERSEAEERGLLSRVKGRSGWTIGTQASEELFTLFANGKINAATADAIASTAPQDAALQSVGVKAALTGASAEMARNTMLAAKLNVAEKQSAGVQGDLFGFDDSAMREMENQAKIASQQQRMIRDQINAVKGATKRPEQAAKLGVDVKDPASTKAKIDELEALLKRWDNWPMHGDLIAITRGQSTAPAEKPESKPESKPKPAEKPAQKPELSQEEKNQQAYTKLKRDVSKARNASDWAKVVSLVDAAESEFSKTGEFPDQWSDFERYREEAQDKISPRSYVEPITKPLIENQGRPKIELTDAEKALGDALDGLFASKLASEAALKASNLQSFSNNIPPDRLGAMIGAASKLIASGVNTPEGMANSIKRLELSAGKIGALRQFSEAIWSAFRMVDTTLTKDVDWGKVYAGLEVPASTPDAKGDQNESTPNQDSTNAAPQESTAPEDRKQAEEQRELEYVKYARGVVQGQGDAKTKYDRLVEVYEAMPALNAKTSTSKINQAFSTPLPLAYAASMMGDTGANLSTYESSGGHSSLLIEVDANNENVTLNELDPRRLERVKTVSDSWKFTNEDATTQVLPEKVMRIAGNPPFGSVTMDDGSKKVFTTEMGETTTIDHAILLQSLANMDENGRAVFIIGGPPPLAKSENGRKEYYSKGAAAKFFAHLYENYGVIDHVTVNGDIYKKQGAGWPVDIIVIQGKAKSKTALPSAKVPKMLNSWGEVFNHSQLNDNERIESRTLTEDEIRANLRNLSNELEGLRGQRNAENDDGPPPIPDGRKDQQQGEGAGIRPGSDEAVSNRPDADTTQDGQPGVDETGVNQRPSGRSGDSNQSDTRANRPSDSSKPVTKFQSKYTPFSKGNTLDTLIPTNMADAVADAFERIKKDVGGDLAEFVKSELGYKPGEDINKHFAGEQIDALAAAIWNFQRGGALIVGDQTGIGKGRIAAGLMRYAVNKGLVPVFVTEKPNLLDSMLRGDLVDIEADSIVKPSILLSEMSKFEEGKKRKLPFGKKYFEQVAASGKLGEGANAIFALYSQIQADTDPTVSKETRGQAKRDKMAPQSYWRTAALKKLAPNAVFILDESHNAAGESITGFRMAEILRNSSRVYYSSATSAKRPENMGIYFKTNIGKVTNGSMDQLVEVMQSGGVPAMQLGSYMLARDGQYLRRERSFEGIKFETTITTETADRDIALADNLTYALRQIVKVQERMAQVAEIVNDRVAQAAKASKIPSTNRDKLESGNFSSKVHNVVSQYLLAIKTKAAVAESIKAIREGKKVVVGLSNTMESAIEDLRQFKDNPDTDFTMSYKGLVMRYLDKMRIMKNGDEEFEITDNPDPRYKDYSTQTLFQMAVQKEGRGEDGAVTINSTIVQEIVRRYMWDEYSAAREQVLRADLGDLPLSPIDAMRQAMEEYGVRTGEITGRTTGLDANGEIYERSESDVKLGGVRYRDAFNDEDLDFLVINQSGSTGINLHAGEKMKNKKPRKMIVVQPSLDINVFMQMLGRIHRSGQVVLPEFSLLQTTLPAEFRPAAILAVKMAMLNANTTSNAKSDVSEGNQVTDIFNKYGDQVVYAALERDPDLQNQFAPFGSIFNKIFNDNGGMIPFQEAKRELEGQPDGYIARAITGYLAVLPVEEQQIFWDKITAEYNAMIDYLNEMGQNDLESKALELKAKTISKEVFTGGGQGDSVFEEPSYVETVETAIGKQPVTGQKAVEITKSAQSEMRQIHADYYNSANQKIEERIAQSKAKSVKWSDEKEAKMRGDMIESRNIIANALRMLGAMGTIKREDGSTGLAVIESVKLDPEKPFAPGSQIFTLQVNDGRRTLKISASKIKEAFEPQMPSASEWDNTTFVGSTRSIVTGNLLAAIRKLNGTGQIISYTTDSGQTQMGVLLPAGFTKRAEAEKARTRNLESIDDFMKAFADEAKVYSVNKTVQLVPNLEKGKIEIRVPASRSAGGKYWTLPTLNRLMDSGEFKQISSDMRGTFDQSRLAEVLAIVGEKFVAIEKVESDKDGLDSLQASRLKSTKQSDNSTPLLDLIEEASKRPETAERLREAKVGNMNALRAFKALTAKRGKGIALTAQEEQQLLDAEIALGQIMAFDMDAVKGGPTNTGALTVPAAGLARNQSTQQQFNLGSETLDSGQMTLFASNLGQPTSPFYSQLERAIEAKMPNSANAGQVMQIAMQNAKAEEVKWSGLQQALIGMQDEKGKVAKADVLNHLRNEGAVRFEEFVTDLELKPRLNPGVYVDQKDGEWWIITDIEDEGPFDSREEAQSYMMNPNNGYFTIDYDNAPFESRPTRYAQYVLPGGKNYREVVLAMPLEGEKRTPNQIAQERHGKDFYDLTRDQMEAIQAEIERKVTPAYTSSHFPDVPNYVAHMRLNERTDADGNEGLFIEELQSDRHQEGRKKGYKGDNASEIETQKAELLAQEEEQSNLMDTLEPLLTWQHNGMEVRANGYLSVKVKESGRWETYSWDSRRPAEFNAGLTEARGQAFMDFMEAKDRRNEFARKAENLRDKGIPDAPFRTTWPLQLFKRALRDAVASGKDWIGWTVGETQSDRFNLSKQVDEILVDKTTSGKFVVKMKPKGAREWQDVDVMDESKLVDTIGKDLAEKVVQSPESRVTFEGDGLKTESAGMKGFYDNMLPKEIGKYVKQWGGKVEKADLPAIDLPEGWEEKWNNAIRNNDQATLDKMDREHGPATPIWRIDITPEMRKGVEAGQALFASNLGGMNPDRVKDLMEMQSEFGNAVRPPNRASFGDEGVRQVVDVFDIEYEERRERQTVEQWRKAGEEKASKNRASLIRNAKLNATNAAGAVPLAPEDVIGTQIVIEQLVQEAGKDFDKLIEAGTVIQAYRKSMSNVARALASGWDRFMKPEERHRRFLANAILTLPPKVASEIDRTLTPEQAETEIRRKITDRVRRIEKALNDIGTTIDEVLTKQVRLSPDKKGILTDITKDLGKIEKEAIKLYSEHVPLAQIMKRTGITESHMKQLAKKSYDEAMARMIEKVRAGMTLENSGLAASNLTQNGQKVLTEEQIIAEARRLVEIGLGLSPNPHTSSAKSFARRTRPAQKPKQALDGAADRMAKNWVAKLQSTQSGSPKLQPTKKQELSEMIRKHTKAEVANFVEKAMRLGVSEQQARILDIECRNAREKALRLRYENVKSAEFIKWSRPEFQSGLLQYDFDTKDLDEIKMTVATLTDLTKAVGKVQLLEGKKRSEAEALLAKLDSILAKYGTDAIEVANGGKPLESYRFDISDRQHVYIVANAIRAVDADWIDKGVEYYYFSLLSGIQTAAVNASSLYHGVWDATVGRFSEIVANAFVKNPMNASLGEWRYVARAMAPMISRAKSNFIAAFGAEAPFFEQDILGVPADLDAVLEGHGMYHKTAISGRKGRFLRIFSRTLLATDEFVKTINASAEVGAMAYRIARAAGLKAGTPEFEDKIKELVNIPGSMAWRMAAERAYRRTFTNALPGQIDQATGQTRPVRTIGEVAGMVVAKTQNVLNKKVDSDVAKLGLTLLRMSFFPFIRVPYNITALAMTYTPLSLVDIASLYAISKGIKDPSRKKVAQAEVIERMSRVMQGTVLAGMLWMLGEGDDDDLEKAILVTGSRPYKTTKKGVRETAERLGIGAYSISWPLPNGKRGVFHYGRIEPIATILATTVDTIKEIKLSNRGAKSYGEAATSAMMSFGNQLSDKTFLKGFGDFWKATQGESNMSQFAADKIGVLIPNLIKQSLREIDPVQRASTDDFFTALGYALAPIGQKEAKIDLYGDEIKKRGFSLQRIFDFTDAGTSAVSDVDKMLWRWSQSNPDSEPIPSEPYATYTPQGESKQKKMTDSQARMYREMAGKIFANRVRAMQFNFEKPTEYDIEKVQDIAKEARKAAKNALRYNPNWK